MRYALLLALVGCGAVATSDPVTDAAPAPCPPAPALDASIPETAPVVGNCFKGLVCVCDGAYVRPELWNEAVCDSSTALAWCEHLQIHKDIPSCDADAGP